MKATIEFNLPEEEVEFYCATKGKDMVNVLWEIRDELRKMYKYEELNEDEYKIVERLREFFNDSLNEHEINLDK
jgi:hypothetical protein